MNKEQYCKYLRQYIELNKKLDKANKALKGLFPDFGGLYIDDIAMIVEILGVSLEGGEDTWTEWWVNECDCGKNPLEATINGRTFKPKTPEGLYDMITFWKLAP